MIHRITMPCNSMLQAAPPCSPSHFRVAAALRAGHASGRARRRSKLRLAGPGGSRRATQGLPLRITGGGAVNGCAQQVYLQLRKNCHPAEGVSKVPLAEVASLFDHLVDAGR
jgi:hypothetical protein